MGKEGFKIRQTKTGRWCSVVPNAQKEKIREGQSVKINTDAKEGKNERK